MTFKINDFKAQIGKRGGLAPNNLFIARITPPPSLQLEDIAPELHFFCQSVELPAIEFQSSEIFNQGFGISEKRVTGMQYQILPTVFTVDSDFDIKNFFHKWSYSIFNYDISQGHNHAVDRQFPYELNFKDNYVGKMEIDVFSSTKESKPKIFTYTFDNVYPINVGNISVAWENNDTIMTMPVGFAYDRYKNTATGGSTFSPMRDRNNGVVTDLSSNNTYGEAQEILREMRATLDNIQEINDRLANR